MKTTDYTRTIRTITDLKVKDCFARLSPCCAVN